MAPRYEYAHICTYDKKEVKSADIYMESFPKFILTGISEKDC